MQKQTTNHQNLTPDSLLFIANDGPEIVASNFWQSEMARRGLMFMSTNAGTCRLLIPPKLRFIMKAMSKGIKHIVISVGILNGRESIEWLFEDNSNTPLVIHLDFNSCDLLFSRDDADKKWKASIWDYQNDRPAKYLELPAYCQYVPHLPCLKRIQ